MKLFIAELLALNVKLQLAIGAHSVHTVYIGAHSVQHTAQDRANIFTRIENITFELFIYLVLTFWILDQHFAGSQNMFFTWINVSL